MWGRGSGLKADWLGPQPSSSTRVILCKSLPSQDTISSFKKKWEEGSNVHNSNII